MAIVLNGLVIENFFLNESGDLFAQPKNRKAIKIGFGPSSGVSGVISVNGQTGVVLIDADDIPETASRKWLTPAEQSIIAAALVSTDNTITFGDANDTDKTIEINLGLGANNPKIRYNTITNRFQFSNDGVTFVDFGSGDVPFNWNRPITRVPSVGLNVGNFTTLTTGLEELLFPFLSATLSLNAFAVREVGATVSPQIIGTLTPNSETVITQRRIIDVTNGDAVLSTPATNNISFPGPSILMVEGITNTYRLEADVGNNGNPTTILSPQRSVSGVFPFLFGSDPAANLSGTALYDTTSKLVETQSNKTINFNFTNEKLYFAYPDDYPNLTSILDQNSFEILGATFPLTPSVRSVTSTGLTTNYTKNFKVYESVALTAVNNANFQFIF